MRLVHLILTQVYEDLLAPVQVNLYAVEYVLDQVCQRVPSIRLIVQIVHPMATVQCFRTHVTDLIN